MMSKKDIPEELWLPIKDWPGYEVSDRGRVKSLDRIEGECWCRVSEATFERRLP